MATQSETAAAGARTSLPAHNWKWFLLRGVLGIILGVVAILFPLSALFAFTLVFAAYAFVDGIASLISGIRGARAGESWGALVFRGVLGILVGVIFVLMPFLATVTYAFVSVALLAAWSIVAGVLEIVAAIRLRREIEGEWLLGVSGLISVLLGIAIFLLVIPYPAATLLSAAWLIAIYAFASGIVLLVQAFRLKKRQEG
jgi:uncharacterized membrane protein HdeD (DUF308 family)